MRWVTLRAGVLAVLAIGAVAFGSIVVSARRGALRQVKITQLVTEFGTDVLREEVAAERLLRGATPARGDDLRAARRAARSTLAQARRLTTDPALATLELLHTRYELAVDDEQIQSGSDLVLRAAIHDRQVVPAFEALRARTATEVRHQSARSRSLQDRSTLLSVAALALTLLVATGLLLRLLRSVPNSPRRRRPPRTRRSDARSRRPASGACVRSSSTSATRSSSSTRPAPYATPTRRRSASMGARARISSARRSSTSARSAATRFAPVSTASASTA